MAAAPGCEPKDDPDEVLRCRIIRAGKRYLLAAPLRKMHRNGRPCEADMP
jgi:hypothetical protein